MVYWPHLLWHVCGSREGNGTLRKMRWAPPRPYGHMIAALARGFMFFMPLSIHQTSHWGDSHGHQREYGSVMNDPLSGALWASLHSSQACNCLGKHVRALQMLHVGNWASRHNETAID